MIILLPLCGLLARPENQILRRNWWSSWSKVPQSSLSLSPILHWSELGRMFLIVKELDYCIIHRLLTSAFDTLLVETGKCIEKATLKSGRWFIDNPLQYCHLVGQKELPEQSLNRLRQDNAKKREKSRIISWNKFYIKRCFNYLSANFLLSWQFIQS